MYLFYIIHSNVHFKNSLFTTISNDPLLLFQLTIKSQVKHKGSKYVVFYKIMAYSKAIGIKLENYHIDQCIINIFNEVESKKNRNTFYFTLLRTIVISKLQGGVRRLPWEAI